MGKFLEGLKGFGGLISGAIGVGQSLIDRKTQQMNIDKTLQSNKHLADYQYGKDLEMWNRQNEYNSPVNQMERFKSAGLNPNLIYGQGSAGNATQLPKYQAPQAHFNYKPLNLAPILGMYQDFTLKQAQIDNVREQNKVIQADAKRKSMEAFFSELFYGSRAMGMSYKEQEMEDMRQLRRNIENEAVKLNPLWVKSQYNKWSQTGAGLERWNADINRIKVDTEFKQKQIEYMLFDRISKLFPSFMPKFGYKIK